MSGDIRIRLGTARATSASRASPATSRSVSQPARTSTSMPARSRATSAPRSRSAATPVRRGRRPDGRRARQDRQRRLPRLPRVADAQRCSPRDARLLSPGRRSRCSATGRCSSSSAIWMKTLTGSRASRAFSSPSRSARRSARSAASSPTGCRRPLMIVDDFVLAGDVPAPLRARPERHVDPLPRRALYGLGGDLFAASRGAAEGDAAGRAARRGERRSTSIREGLRLIAPLAGAGIYAAGSAAAPSRSSTR